MGVPRLNRAANPTKIRRTTFFEQRKIRWTPDRKALNEIVNGPVAAIAEEHKM